MLTFHIVEILARLFPDPSGPLASFAGDLFDILGCYFPIHFTHVSLMNTSHFQICTYLSYFLVQKGNQKHICKIFLICWWEQIVGILTLLNTLFL